MRKTTYSVIVGKAADVKEFAKKIGFSIRRKDQKLKDALIISTRGARTRPVVWKQMYSKIGGEWVRKENRPQ